MDVSICSKSSGSSVPIPTLPSLSILNFSVAAVDASPPVKTLNFFVAQRISSHLPEPLN